MNKTLVTLALAAVASGAAFAGEADPSGQFALQIQGSRTRAEVQAEAADAIAHGQLRPSNPHASAYVQPVLKSGKTRAEVTADFLAHREEVAALTGEDSGSAYLARLGTPQADHQYFAGLRRFVR